MFSGNYTGSGILVVVTVSCYGFRFVHGCMLFAWLAWIFTRKDVGFQYLKTKLHSFSSMFSI